MKCAVCAWQLESYLPQLALMIVCLPVDSLLSSVLERFALRVCESNAHWALQLSWVVFAHMEDHRPELQQELPSAEQSVVENVYGRAARLLQLVEQELPPRRRAAAPSRRRAAAPPRRRAAPRRRFTRAAANAGLFCSFSD